MKIVDRKYTSLDYFAESEEVSSGTIVGFDNRYNPKRPVVNILHNCENKVPIGISLNDVVNLNSFLLDDGEISPGGRIQILREGQIIWWFHPKLKLPINQPIYINSKKSKLTWKNKGIKVGCLLKPQDIDGYCNIYLNFIGV